MSKYFGKFFGPSTRAPKFSTQMPQLFIISICFTIKAWRKLVQSVVWVRVLRICARSSILSVLCSGFWVSGSQVPSPRDPVPWSWVSGSQFQGPKSRVPGLKIPGSQVSGSQGPGSQGPSIPGLRVSRPRALGPGSQVLILDYALHV